MAFARRFLNSTLFPDGTVLVTGGTSQANARNDAAGMESGQHQFRCRTLEPCNGDLVHLAAMQTPRSYHSTAALLPDGRVLVGWGRGSPTPTTRSTTAPLKFSRPLTCSKAHDPPLPKPPPQ